MDMDVFKTAFTDWLQKSQDSLIKSDWQTVAKDYPFVGLPNQQLPYADFNKKLKFCRVCVVTGSALYLREKHQPFAVNAVEGDFSYRSIPRQIFADDIEICHEYSETKYGRQDINVVFPLERLRELEEAEVIGELAERNYSIYDFIPQADRITDSLARPLGDALVNDEIDVALMLPVCELGHQTMILLQREFEKRGIATVLVASHAKALTRLQPPRVVTVDCPDGAPLGEPGNVKKQRAFVTDVFNFVANRHKPGAVLNSTYAWQDPFQ